ncbi:MAG: alpha/beta fold hydrolase [Pseudobdellovibrionaceae bacterium]|nr:alpha/beta fold hydrolase [Pseudobdellovibrionaceae bacterium]
MSAFFSWKFLQGFLTASVMAYVGFIVLLFLLQRVMMYLPPKLEPSELTSLLNSYEPISVVTEDGLKISGFFTPPIDTQKPIIIAFHGNASHPAWQSYKFKGLVEKGYGILLAEYRYYGGNPGKPSEDGFYKDARAYINAKPLLETYKNNPLILYGQSLGSGVAVQLASDYPERASGIVLEVPYDTMVNVAKKHYPFVIGMKYLLKDKFMSVEKVDKLTMPKLFILAGRDEVVGFKSGSRLYDASPEPKDLIVFELASHNQLPLEKIQEELEYFCESITGEKK